MKHQKMSPALPTLSASWWRSWLRAVILLTINRLLLEENEYHLILIFLIILLVQQSQHKIRFNLWGKNSKVITHQEIRIGSAWVFCVHCKRGATRKAWSSAEAGTGWGNLGPQIPLGLDPWRLSALSSLTGLRPQRTQPPTCFSGAFAIRPVPTERREPSL